MNCRFSSTVMAGLVPAIHAFQALRPQDMDTRDKPGHDERMTCCVSAEERAR
ncbi:hypothetical protein [Microvirga aerophila]|uniref:hypothetical protein n=1 Tax=Microvirga aerophila TaxID=670291 RepID=UPI0013B44752|nr:hypothetical protein [Microvirga aerophila]